MNKALKRLLRGEITNFPFLLAVYLLSQSAVSHSHTLMGRIANACICALAGSYMHISVLKTLRGDNPMPVSEPQDATCRETM